MAKKKKLTLSKADPTLERLVESVLVEIMDDEHGFIEGIDKEYIMNNGVVFSTTIHLVDSTLNLDDVYKSILIGDVIDKLDSLSTLFKQFRRACRKIEEEGYNTEINFNEDYVIINVACKEAEVAKPIKVKPDVTLRKFKFESVYNDYPKPRTAIPKDCDEHYILDIFGGIDETELEELIESLKNTTEVVKISSGQIGEVYNKSRVKLIGWETDMPTKEYDLYYLKSDCFKVTVADIKSGKQFKMYGYLFKETEKEFKRRLCEYAEKALDIIHHSSGSTKTSRIPYTIGTHFVELEYALHEAQQMLMKYDSEECHEGSSSIIEKCEEHVFNERQLKNKNRRFY
jgi:hypothetical protein